MNPAYSFVANHLWQSTAFAALAGLLTLALRKNSAQARYWLWFAASLKFLIPVAALIALGSQMEFRVAPAHTPQLAIAVSDISQPFAQSTGFRVPVRRISGTKTMAETMAGPAVVLTIWLCGALGVTFMWWQRWSRLRAIVRAGSPLPHQIGIEARSTDALIEPGVFGFFRPVLLLPAGIAGRLTPPQLKAVIAHELCHVRRRDNLAAAMHMVVEAIFWFHPMVWWLGSRLIAERERACDEEVLRLGSEPQEYAAGILNVCQFYLESPLACASGVTGADLKKRIAEIMTSRVALRLSPLQKMALAAAACVALAVPVAIGVAQSTSGRPVFQVASIKPSNDGRPFRMGTQFNPSGHFQSWNVTARQLVEMAYDLPGNKDYVSGGEKWMDEQRYNIEAKAEDGVIQPKMSDEARNKAFRLMVRAMLEDRFHLKVHPEMKEVSIFALLVDKNGSRLTKAPERDCSGDFACHGFHGGRANGVSGQTVSMEDLAEILTIFSDRVVKDMTGIAGNFDITVPAWSNPLQPPGPGVLEGREAAPDPSNPDLPTVLKQTFGLKLESRKAKVETFVIDRLDRPSEN